MEFPEIARLVLVVYPKLRSLPRGRGLSMIESAYLAPCNADGIDTYAIFTYRFCISICRRRYSASETNADGSMNLEQFEAMLRNLVFFNNEARTFEGGLHSSTRACVCVRAHTHVSI